MKMLQLDLGNGNQETSSFISGYIRWGNRICRLYIPACVSHSLRLTKRKVGYLSFSALVNFSTKFDKIVLISGGIATGLPGIV